MLTLEGLCVSSALRTEFHGLCQCQTCEVQFFSWDSSVIVDLRTLERKQWKNLEDWRWKGQVSAQKDQGGRVHGKSTHLILRRLEFYAEQGTNLLNECSQ